MNRLVLAALAAITLSTNAVLAQTPVLRASATVSSDLVRIGDLVDNVSSSKARIAIFRAPDLGETGSVPATQVLAALRAHDVLGVYAGGMNQVSVTRASRVLEAADIRVRIAQALSERMRIADPANVAVLPDTPLQPLHVDPSDSTQLTPVRINLDGSGRFEIVFRIENRDVRFTGIASEAADTVVVTRSLNRGDILNESDIAIEKRSRREIQGEPLRDVSAAIGMALQQSLRAGQPVRGSDVTRPQLVKRGETVVMNYQVPGIALTVRGKAEDGGALGDIVNITNVQSKRTVQGVVSGPGQVTVSSMTPRVTSALTNSASPQQVTALVAGR